MKLIEVDIESVYKSRRYRRGFLQDLIDEFLHSGMKAAEVIWNDHYDSANSAYSSLFKAISKRHAPVRVSYAKHSNKIYLIREEDEDA